jgi:anti-sigma factor RsiW
VTKTSACPTEQQMAAFVDGTLAAGERADVQRHLDRCDACFDLAATLGTLAIHPPPVVDDHLRDAVVRTPARPGWVRRALPAMSVAAALLLAVAWWKGPSHPTSVAPNAPAIVTAPSSEAGAMRSTGSAADRVVLEQPRDGDLVRSRPEIRWTGPADAVSYEVQVTTPGGDVLWRRQVDGAHRTLTIDAPLPAGQACYVWVAAYLPQGRRITSNIVKVKAASED